MIGTAAKTHENKLRRAAARQGLKLAKRRRYDPRARDYGLWALVDAETGRAVNPALHGQIYSWTLAQCEQYLNKKDQPS